MLFTTNCVSFFGNIHSEKILQVTLLFKYWVDVFGDKKKFNTWLETDNLALGRIKPKSFLPKDWKSFPHPHSKQLLGDKFISEMKHLVMQVPSASVQGEYNYLINPKHKDFKKIKLIKSEQFVFNERLFIK